MDEELQDCIDSCQACRDVCARTLEYADEQGAGYIDEAHIVLLEDCVKICDTSVDFMERGSANHQKTCGVCAEICAQCAEACEAISDDEQMQECARACRECAASCQEMSEL